jgi:hypothetical protein
LQRLRERQEKGGVGEETEIPVLVCDVSIAVAASTEMGSLNGNIMLSINFIEDTLESRSCLALIQALFVPKD